MIEEMRDGVVSYLAEQFASAEVVAGERDGKWNGEKDLIAVWWPGWDELARDTMLATPTLTVRYFPAISKQPSTDTPINPAAIEQAADVLITAFDRASSVPGFFATNVALRLSSLRPDYRPDVWRVEGTLIAYTLGAGA